MFQHKIKSVSPLIATILLIVVAVILVVVVLTWGKDFVGKSLEETKIFYQESDLTGLITSQGNINNFITIANNSKKDITVVGYRIFPNIDNPYYSLLDGLILGLDPIFIPSRSSRSIYINCIPSNSFNIDFLLSDNSYVRVPINTRGNIDGLCSFYDRLLIYADFSLGDFRDRTGINTLSPSNVELVKDGDTCSAEFNGVDSTIITDSTDPAVWQSGFTLIAWVNPKSYGGSDVGRIFDKTTYITGSDGLNVYITSDLNGLRARTVGGTVGQSADNSIKLNKWQFVVVTVSSDSKINFYIGDLDNAPALSGDADQSSGDVSEITTTNPLTIGNRSNAIDRTFDGKIKIAKAYSGVLTEEEITRIYKNTKWMVEDD